MSLILHCAVPNVNDRYTTDELLQFLQSETNELDFYRPIPRPGVIQSAAFDWSAVINLTASSITIASILWIAYLKFIKPALTAGNDQAELFIALDNDNDNSTSFVLSGAPIDKDSFIIEFSETIETMRKDQSVEESERIERKFRLSGHYKKL
ncbi:MAG: hypothetical protein HQ556_03170 [Candidatus Marinimicrobia bacterium]|nr:hypothetical protein [Candidatus Neomarinimicrobiota bacterium]